MLQLGHVIGWLMVAASCCVYPHIQGCSLVYATEINSIQHAWHDPLVIALRHKQVTITIHFVRKCSCKSDHTILNFSTDICFKLLLVLFFSKIVIQSAVSQRIGPKFYSFTCHINCENCNISQEIWIRKKKENALQLIHYYLTHKKQSQHNRGYGTTANCKKYKFSKNALHLGFQSLWAEHFCTFNCTNLHLYFKLMMII